MTSWEDLDIHDRALLDAHGGEVTIGLHPSMVRACKGHGNAAILLHQLMYVFKNSKTQDGWLLSNQSDIEEKTGLGARAQLLARKMLVGFGFLESSLQGVPATMHYRPQWKAIASAIRNHLKSPVSPLSAETSFAAKTPNKLRPLAQKQASPLSAETIKKENTQEVIQEKEKDSPLTPQGGTPVLTLVPDQEEPKPQKQKRQPRPESTYTTIPEPFELNDFNKAWIHRQGFHFDKYKAHEGFVDHYRKTGKMWKDWQATWREWMRRAEDYYLRDNPGTLTGLATADNPSGVVL